MIWIVGLALVSATLPKSYHTTDQIIAEVLDLARGPCQEYLTVLDTESVYAYDLTGTNPSSIKSFYLFGEHARELISPEAGLRFIEKICLDEEFRDVLKYSAFRVVLVANPISRRKVEKGDYCLRVNENSVDTNRNWDCFWEPKDCDSGLETCPGPYPFSEKETKETAQLLNDYDASLFLTVHSGALTILSSFAYKPALPNNYDDLLSVLEELQPLCNCKYGAAASVLKYNCPGNCLDYAYIINKIPYAYAFEIYDHSLDINTPSNFLSFLQKPSFSCFMETTEPQSANDCFKFFNPPADRYEDYVEQWAEIFKQLAVLGKMELVQQKEEQGEQWILEVIG